jgi:hypothetical protein
VGGKGMQYSLGLWYQINGECENFGYKRVLSGATGMMRMFYAEVLFFHR